MAYEERAQRFGFATKSELEEALKHPDAVILDVRTEPEIAASGKFERGGHGWVNIACSPMDTANLTNNCDSLFPPESVPIVMYCGCGVGGRSNATKNALEAKGYSSVLNAGGYNDVIDIGL